MEAASSSMPSGSRKLAPSADMRTHKPAFDLEVSAVRLWQALMTYWRVMPT